MHVIALVDGAAVIRRILEHLGNWAPRQAHRNTRGLPGEATVSDASNRPARALTCHPVPDIA
ncbi:MAG: hypothetical protein IT514_13255 [Burkholderiales bacterium]|nr:hypothetical protein [Burkholderiales bacterium]